MGETIIYYLYKNSDINNKKKDSKLILPPAGLSKEQRSFERSLKN